MRSSFLVEKKKELVANCDWFRIVKCSSVAIIAVALKSNSGTRHRKVNKIKGLVRGCGV